MDVTGLTHCYYEGQVEEFLSSAMGKQLTLQPAPENIKDPYAIKVREGLRKVGYIAAPDQELVYQAMKGNGQQKMIKGVVVDCCEKPPLLTVEVETAHIDWEYSPYDDSVFSGWSYDALSLMPEIPTELYDLAQDLIMLLEENQPIGKDLITKAEEMLQGTLYDMSREMVRCLHRLEHLLSERSEPELRQIAQAIRMKKGYLMAHDNRDKVARYLFIEHPAQLKKKGLEKSHFTYDQHLDELEQKLRAFPYSLYDKFLNDPLDFLRELFYKHVPRQLVFGLLSGIVLMIIKGRVRVLKWGRNGDTKPLEDIARLGMNESLTSAQAREEQIRQALDELLALRSQQGDKPVFRQQNQWAAVCCVLKFEYNMEFQDLRDFCRKMEDWGFGRDSGCKTPCCYDSVAKASLYADRPTNKWEKGVSSDRQMKVAAELRAILRKKIGYS